MTLIPASAFHMRKSNDRGLADFGWLKSRHTFSFGQFYDPAFMGFENLRVINDDLVEAGKGFGTHPHQNAEIFSYVLDGALEHKDSMGNGSQVTAGGVQYMSAGSGISHSEFNPLPDQDIRFLQIWLMPNVQNEAPVYENMDIRPEDKNGKLKLFLSHDGRDGSMQIKADADIYAATLSGEQHIEFELGKKGWIQMATGSAVINGTPLNEGDGLAIMEPGTLSIDQGEGAEFLLFELG